jgi:GNAT superfamily N-acetyltransferase
MSTGMDGSEASARRRSARPTDRDLRGFSIEPYDRARHGDGPVRVVQSVYREYQFTWEAGGYHRDLYEIEQAYAPPDHFFDVAVVDSDVVGTIGGEARGGHDGLREAELKRLYVDARCRKLGIGRALAERFLAWARSRGCRRAILWSDKRFTAAHRLYQAAGFRVVGERICPGDPDQSDEHGFAMEL